MWPPWPTSWATPSTPCWPASTRIFTFHSSPAAGRNRLHLRRDDAGRPPAGRGKRRGRAPRPALPPGGRRLRHHPCARPSLPCSSARPTRWSPQGASVDETGRGLPGEPQDQFGDAVEVSDEFRWEWVSIPHIYASAVLRVRLRLRPAAGAVALPAVQARKAKPSSRATCKILSTGGSAGPGRRSWPTPASISTRRPSGRAASTSSPAWSPSSNRYSITSSPT